MLITIQNIYLIGLVLFFLFDLTNFLVRKFYRKGRIGTLIIGVPIVVMFATCWPIYLFLIIINKEIRDEIYEDTYFTVLFLQGK